jgi:hypothetical protein
MMKIVPSQTNPMRASKLEVSIRLLQTILGLATCALLLTHASSSAGSTSIHPIIFYLAFGLVAYTTLLSAFLLLEALCDITDALLSYTPHWIPVWIRRVSSIVSTLMVDLVLISIWAAITTLLISHVLFNTAGGRACAWERRECKSSFVLLWISGGQNVLCLMGLILSTGRVADRDTSLVQRGGGGVDKQIVNVV